MRLTTMSLSIRIGFGLLACAAGPGCDSDFLASGPVRICTEVAVQCVLPEGPLGVCERTPCGGEGGGEAAGACFACAPQH